MGSHETKNTHFPHSYIDDINTVAKNCGISERGCINCHNGKDPMVNMQGPQLDSAP